MDSSTWIQTMNTDRIYQGEDDRWYFNVRGNLAKGPFMSFSDAEDALNQHVRQCRSPLARPSWILARPSWTKALKAIKVGRRSMAEPRHS